MGMKNINAFVLSSAIEKVQSIMEREASLKLTQEDAMLFLDALNAPATPNDKLTKAFQTYRQQTL